jgi:hypothetical protein
MNLPAAFRAAYADWKLVKTRGVVQVIFEVPLADHDAAYDVLGGMPVAGKERWFGIAAIKSHQQEEAPESRQDQPQDSDGDRRPWQTLQPSAQSAIRCGEPTFWAFLREEHSQRVANKEDAATAVRRITGVNSRAHFNENHKARVQWNMLDSQFAAWQAKERVGA